MIVPGLINCANQDYYAMQPLIASNTHHPTSTLISEENIIGRVCLIVYNHDDSLHFWQGYRRDRWMLIP
jgi:hypothetical protein